MDWGEKFNLFQNRKSVGSPQKGASAPIRLFRLESLRSGKPFRSRGFHIMPTFSTAFGLGKTQLELDFVDVALQRDNRLFIDPFANRAGT